MMEAQISGISEVIKLAVASVFLLPAIIIMSKAMNTRRRRLIDLQHLVQDRLRSADKVQVAESEKVLNALLRRSLLANLGIRFSLLAAVLVSLVIAGAPVSALVSVDLTKTVFVLFLLAMLSMTISLGMFLLDVYLGKSSRTPDKHRPEQDLPWGSQPTTSSLDTDVKEIWTSSSKRLIAKGKNACSAISQGDVDVEFTRSKK